MVLKQICQSVGFLISVKLEVAKFYSPSNKKKKKKKKKKIAEKHSTDP